MQVYAVLSDGSAAVFALRDQVRPESAAVIEALHNAGIRPIVMLPGDSEAPATVVAVEVGVDEVKSRLMPDEKVAVVRALRERHGSVAMLGDGVNDAPALAEATVGLAMGATGWPVAIETADVALMGNDLTKLPYAIRLSRKAGRTIRFNIAVAIGLKVVLGVGAVAGVVSLATAFLVGDIGGSLAVTLNALRLAATKRTVKTGSPIDNSVRVFDVKQGEEVIRFEGHTRNVNAVADAPDGRHAVSGSSDRTVRVWKVPD